MMVGAPASWVKRQIAEPLGGLMTLSVNPEILELLSHVAMMNEVKKIKEVKHLTCLRGLVLSRHKYPLLPCIDHQWCPRHF